jgi:hypothetical protein
MPKFLAVHPLARPMAAEEGGAGFKLVRANSTRDTYWVRSWIQGNEEGKATKLFCEWNAGSAEDVRNALKNIPVPTEGIYPMAIVDSEDYR